MAFAVCIDGIVLAYTVKLAFRAPKLGKQGSAEEGVISEHQPCNAQSSVQEIWKQSLHEAVLAAPAVDMYRDALVVASVSGNVTGFSMQGQCTSQAFIAVFIDSFLIVTESWVF